MTHGGNLLVDGRNQAEYNMQKHPTLSYEGLHMSSITTAPRKMGEEDAGTAMQSCGAPIMAKHIHKV